MRSTAAQARPVKKESALNENHSEGRYVTFGEFDESFTFFIDNPADLIQSRHASRRLYEREELEIIRAYAPLSGIFYDIGANVGNHAVFMGKVLRAKKVYPFEANPRAAEILRKNIIANDLADVIDTAFLGYGIGLEGDSLQIFNPQQNNLGAARLKKKPEGSDDLSYFGSVEIRSIDNLALRDDPDFIKIDVEGMEIDVLSGMIETIAKCRPPIFIEVNSGNVGTFNQWTVDNHYEVQQEFVRYKSSVNFMITAA